MAALKVYEVFVKAKKGKEDLYYKWRASYVRMLVAARDERDAEAATLNAIRAGHTVKAYDGEIELDGLFGEPLITKELSSSLFLVSAAIMDKAKQLVRDENLSFISEERD